MADDPDDEEFLASLLEVAEKAERDRQLADLYASQPRGADLILDDEALIASLEGETAAERTEPPARYAKRLRTEDGIARRKRKDAERKRKTRAKPLPYVALAGRQLVARKRIIEESRKRRSLLTRAMMEPNGNPVLVALRALDDGRHVEVVTAWRVRELLRAALLREPKLREIADEMPRLKLTGASKLTHVGRLLERAERLEAADVWDAFDVLAP